MMDSEDLGKKSNKRIYTGGVVALSLYERAKSLYLLDLYRKMRVEDEVNNILKHQK